MCAYSGSVSLLAELLEGSCGRRYKRRKFDFSTVISVLDFQFDFSLSVFMNNEIGQF